MRARQWILVFGLTLVFIPGLRALAGVWSSLDYYSHGFLVPIVSLWIGLSRARKLGEPRAHPVGLLWVAAALALYAGGLGFGSASTMGLAAVIAAGGVVWHFWGISGVRRLAFPLALLLFVVPIPPAVLNPVVLQLQFFVSRVAVDVLHLAGFTVLRDGNVVELPGGPLFVAEACSGITSIVTLLPLGAVLAYFTERRLAARLALVAAVVPIAMFGNLMRVVAPVVAADALGIERATGSWLHESAGLITFTLECALLIGLGALVAPRVAHAPAATGSAQAA